MKDYRHLFTLCLTLLLAMPTIARADDAKQSAFEPYEAWYVLKLGGQKAGHMHTALTLEDGKIVNKSEMVIAIKRGQTELRIEQKSSFVETATFKPISATSNMKLALMATEQQIDFTGDEWVITSKNAGQESKTTMKPIEGDWLTPGGLSVHLRDAIAKGEEDITVTTLDPSMGATPVTVTMKRGETKDIEVFGKVTQATLWTTTMTNAPGVEIEQWTDESGQPVKQMIPLMPGMEIEMLLADKALALAEFDAPEMLAASFITPDKTIKNPRKLKRAVFELVSADLKKNIGDTIPNDGYQRTQWVDDETLRVTIDLDKPTLPERFEVRDATLQASSMLNFEDEAIQKLINEAIDVRRIKRLAKYPTLRPMYQAQRNAAKDLRDFVREHIEAKDLSVGFASASETARTKQGDCTEHACLLAAMLRGAGIPSRTVTGLVYADQFAGHEGIFGFHMWTQAWIAGDNEKHRWVDLDAAMPGDIEGFDATHIALSTSAMKDGENFNDMVALLPLMQGMQIKVIELEWAE